MRSNKGGKGAGHYARKATLVLIREGEKATRQQKRIGLQRHRYRAEKPEMTLQF